MAELLLGNDPSLTSCVSCDVVMMLQLLSVLLDKSDSVPLLLGVHSLLSDWLLCPKPVLQPKEKAAFLSRMAASLDRLPSDAAALPLHQLFLRLLLKLLQASAAASTAPSPPPDVASSSSSLSSAPSSLAWVAAAVARPAMTGLLAADPSLRHDFLTALFGPSNQPRLVSMLKHDWDALASRYVVVPLVDVLLGGLQQQHCPLTLVAPGPTPNPTPVSTLWAPPRMRPASSTLGGTSEASQALAGTRRSEARQRVAQAHHEVMARLHNMRQAGLGTALLGPLRHLLHAHPLLAKDLLGPLLQSAWSGLSEAQQGQQGAALVALLCKGTPRQALALPTYLQPSAAGLQHSINSIQALLQVHKLTTPCLPHETHKTHAFVIIDISYLPSPGL